MGHVVLNLILAYARPSLAHPSYDDKLEIQVLKARRHFFEHGNFSLKNIWGLLWLLSQTHVFTDSMGV